MKINKKLALCLLIASASLFNKKTLPSGTCTQFGPIKVTTPNGSTAFGSGTVYMYGDIQIGQGSTLTDKITLKSGNITNPGAGKIIGLTINENGELVSSERAALTIFGDEAKSFISLDNATSGTENIVINAGGTGKVNISAVNIAPKAGSEYTVMQMDENKNVYVTATPNIFCGNLDAGSTTGALISLGQAGASTGNFIIFHSSSNGMSIRARATGATINLEANDKINIKTGNITNPATGTTAHLGIDEFGNLLIVSGGSQTFTDISAATSTTTNYNVTLGNVSSGNALSFTNNTGNVTLQSTATSTSDLSLTASQNVGITGTTVDMTGTTVNMTGTAVKVTTASFTLDDTSLLPAPGCTNTLTIDENGKIGIVVSTATKKRNITDIGDTMSWGDLNAHNYNYLNSDRTEFGYIAEELAETKEWNNFVIYDKENKPMSVNYNGIFVAAMHIAKTKITQAEAKIESLEKEITSKNLSLEKMENKMTELEEQYKILAGEIAQFKLYKQMNEQL